VNVPTSNRRLPQGRREGRRQHRRYAETFYAPLLAVVMDLRPRGLSLRQTAADWTAAV
jgi:hypothetical protein